MAKSSAGTAGYRCTECGWQAPKWTGRCGECQAWGTVEEAGTPRLARAGIRAVTYRTAAPVSTPAVPIGQVDATDARARPSGLDELDRVLGGGLVPGAVLLLAGEPGVGKSTLLLETGALVAEAGPVLYVTGEESAAQVRSRADRIGAVSDQLFLAAETDLDAVLGHVDAVEPRLLIIDSVQTIAAAGVEGSPGGVTQVRAVASALISVAKERSMATILVGHVTKDGSVAGPRALEHLVDVVLHFDGDRHSQLRMVRAVKNRYGPTDEVGCFDLGEYGLIGLPDPSGLFLSQHREPVPGTCVTVTLEGRRPLPAEVQALVGNSVLEVPRRTTSGLDAARVGLVLAVLQRRAGLKLGRQDVYAATVGGVRLTEPSVDLAVAISLASSAANLSVPHGVVAIGEVGLAGEVRRVAGLSRRLAEAERMGFRRAVVPAGSAGLEGTRDASAAHRGGPGRGHPPGAGRGAGHLAARLRHARGRVRIGGVMTTPYTEPVLAWFSRHARDLPWRGPGATPWSVLVSEIMLQQTPVARVVPAHQGWLARWPTPAALAAEPAGEAIRQWGRLGYPRRALRLHETATIVTARHGGTVPDDIDALLALPGIGSYTAAAVASFAFGQRHAVLDTNVRRVLARLVDGQPRPRSTPSPAERRMAESLLPAEPAVAACWSVAVMELGALVCTAASPRCAECPVARHCAWLAAGRPPEGAELVPAPGAAVRRHGPAVPRAPARGAPRRRRSRHCGRVRRGLG